jgi:hypothetical protein
MAMECKLIHSILVLSANKSAGFGASKTLPTNYIAQSMEQQSTYIQIIQLTR